MGPIPTTDDWTRLLSTYEGRDKLIRASYYALLLITGRLKAGPFTTRLLNLAKALSAARTVGRRFNDLPMLKATLAHFRMGAVDGDRFQFLVNGVVNVLYTIYHPVEHIAWLSSLELIPMESSKWWNYTVWLWTVALIFSILRSVRNYGRFGMERYKAMSAGGENSIEERGLKKRQLDELWNMVVYVSDLMVAVNYLPKGILWSQTLPQWKVGAYGLVASVVGLMKIFQRLRNST